MFLLEQRAAKHGAMIFDPVGRLIADGTGADDPIIYAEVDLSDVIIPKLTHDTAGHYNRPELFAGLFDNLS